jgi:MoaA/NifB/PqqE/SkfB family radical SAM enzyme
LKDLKKMERLPFRQVFRFLPAIPVYLFHRVRRDGRSCPPLVITVELTRLCNLSCPYCYLDKAGGRAELMSPVTLGRILDEFSGPSPVIHLTGGEPFLRPDLDRIISRVKAAGSYCAVSTNGTLISRQDTPWLKVSAPDQLTISLNGPEEAHDRVTSLPGSFRRTMRGIDYLAELGRLDLVSVNCLFHPGNLASLEEFLGLVAEKGIGTVSFLHPMPDGAGAGKEEAAGRGEGSIFDSLEPAAITGIMAAVRRKGRVLGIGIRFVPELEPAEIARWYSGGYARTCRYPYFAVRIDPGGDVYPCHNFPYAFGNVRTGRLLDIWNGPEYRRLRAGLGRYPRPAGCSNCCKI